jgi:hypothetical protein
MTGNGTMGKNPDDFIFPRDDGEPIRDFRKAVAWGRLLRRYSDLVRRNGTFTTRAIKDSSQRRIIHRFFELEKGISTRSMDVGEWPDGVYPCKRMVLSIDIKCPAVAS